MTATRRTFLEAVTALGLGTGLATSPIGSPARASDQPDWGFRYLLPSSMYGTMDLAVIVPEVRKIGATGLDIWPRVHGNQREQLDAMGEAAFEKLLAEHDVTLECLTQYKLGPFGLTEEMAVAKRLGCRLIVTGSKGPKGLSGSELKAAVATFVESMKPHLAVAEEAGVTIAIENHANALIESPDSMKWLAELSPSNNLAIAFAPYHLPQNSQDLATWIRQLGERIAVFYAWQHGAGSHTAQPREQEHKQLPGRGDLDFTPLVEALHAIGYSGWTEIFMHPYPRGLAAADTAAEVTAAVNHSRRYLESCIPASS